MKHFKQLNWDDFFVHDNILNSKQLCHAMFNPKMAWRVGWCWLPGWLVGRFGVLTPMFPLTGAHLTFQLMLCDRNEAWSFVSKHLLNLELNSKPPATTTSLQMSTVSQEISRPHPPGPAAFVEDLPPPPPPPPHVEASPVTVPPPEAALPAVTAEAEEATEAVPSEEVGRGPRAVPLWWLCFLGQEGRSTLEGGHSRYFLALVVVELVGCIITFQPPLEWWAPIWPAFCRGSWTRQPVILQPEFVQKWRSFPLNFIFCLVTCGLFGQKVVPQSHRLVAHVPLPCHVKHRSSDRYDMIGLQFFSACFLCT